MNRVAAMRGWLALVCVGMALALPAPAQALPPEPDFVFFPHLSPSSPPPPELVGPCGLAVSRPGGLYVANYYATHIEAVSPPNMGTLQVTSEPLDGPCGLGFDSTNRLYVNAYHRNVVRYTPTSFPPGPTTVFATRTVIDSSHPTGVAVDHATDDVYVDARTHIAAYDSSGAPLMDGPDPMQIGEGSLGDGYGLAVSGYPGTAGRIYVPDHADDTVKVYDPNVDLDDPVQTIAGPPGGFGSLRDSAVAVDRVTGEIYVADTLAYPQHTEHPQASVYVFAPNGTYKGRLKYNIVDGSPPGLAVDNSEDNEGQPGPTQGRVYLTSGNTIRAAIYAYPPGSATFQSGPPAFSLALDPGGEGEGSITSSVGAIECSAACEEQVRSGAQVVLSATPDEGSAFAGWSGEGCSGTGTCVVAMSQARSVRAEFRSLSGPPAPPQAAGASAPATRPVIAQKGNLRVAVSGRLAPRRLPRHGAAPISVTVGGEISTTDKSLPPKLKALRIELNRHGRLDAAGLPACDYERIQPGSSSRALSACRESLVGEGSFTANITLAGQEPYPTKGKLLVFHSVQNGKPVLYGHIYSPKPFATSFVIVFNVQRLGKGTYGTALDAPLPAAMDAWGRLTGLQMTLSRRYSHKGESASFISAGCPAPKGFPGATFPLARTEFAFEGNKRLSSVLSATCKAQG